MKKNDFLERKTDCGRCVGKGFLMYFMSWMRIFNKLWKSQFRVQVHNSISFSVKNELIGYKFSHW